MRARSVALLCFLAACLTNPDPREPSVESMPKSRFGAWIVVTERDGDIIDGELLAIDNGTIYVKPGARQVEAIPLHLVREAEVYKYESDWGFGVWGALGTLATISHGAWLIISAPVWIITSSVAAGMESYHVRLKIPDDDIDEITKWARYPQGMPTRTEPTAAPEDAWTLTKRGKNAARDDQCDAVKDFGYRVRELDPGMHEQVFLRDEAIRRCLGLPSLIAPDAGVQDIAPDAGVSPDAGP